MTAIRNKGRAVLATSLLMLSTLAAAPAAGAAENAAVQHCVLYPSGELRCYDTFDESLRSVGIDGEAALPKPGSRTADTTATATAASSTAILYNYKNWDASGGTLSLFGCPASGNLGSSYNDWASSVQGTIGCAVRLWQHSNFGGNNSGWLYTAADLGDVGMNNAASSYEIG